MLGTMTRKIKKLAQFVLWVFLLWASGLVLFTTSVVLHKPHDPHKTSDAIVVLTGGFERIETGLELFAAGKAMHLFITGVHPRVKMDKIINKWKGETALPPCCITLGYAARTTVQNGAETRAWLEAEHYSSIRLVTADFHMNRALIELRHALPGIEIIPHPVSQPDATPEKLWFWLVSAIEYHKTLVRWPVLMFSPRPVLHTHEHD